MKDITEIITILQNEKQKLALDYAVKDIAVFGSYGKGQENPQSDIDIMVDFYEDPSLIRFLKLKYMLSDLIGINVDLVMKSALRQVIGEKILKEAIKI